MKARAQFPGCLSHAVLMPPYGIWCHRRDTIFDGRFNGRVMSPTRRHGVSVAAVIANLFPTVD